MEPQPPKWARRLLAWYCKPHLLEEIEGDLHELFAERVAIEGEKAARQQYAWDVVRYLRPHTVRRQTREPFTPLHTDMLRNYFTISLRSLWRNRLYTALNVTGLAIGISACLVIYLIVHFELSFDSFHPDRERIYRVYTRQTGDFLGVNCGVTGPLPSAVRQNITGIETVAALHNLSATDVQVTGPGKKDRIFKGQFDVVVAEPQYFEVFSAYQWLAGSPRTSLNAPFQVVLTESKAKTYFGVDRAETVLGRTLHYNDSLLVTVSGIVRDLPQPTDLFFQDFISFRTIGQSWLKNVINLEDWNQTRSTSFAFVKLRPGAAPGPIEAQVAALVKPYLAPNANVKNSFPLQPLADLHYNLEVGVFNFPAADLRTLRIQSGVALLLLLIAAINFINLVTAQAVRRAKEVGVRKVLGGLRRQLIGQFLSETLLVTAAAVLLSLLLAYGALQYFKEFIPQGVSLDLTNPATQLFLLATLLGVSLLSGLYPAFVLSSFTPITTLKNAVYAAGGRTGSAFLRKGLIVFQFSCAQVLIVGTFIVSSQLDFMLDKDLGFKREAVVTFFTPFNAQGREDRRLVLKEELGRLPGVTALSMHSAPPTSIETTISRIEYDNGKEILQHQVFEKFTDPAYFQLYDIPLVAGRNLLPSDTVREYVINETYARQLGFARPEQALGKMLNRKYPIVGVVKDFHVQSLHSAIPPVALSGGTGNLRCVGLQLSMDGEGTGRLQAKLEAIKKVWDRMYPNDPFRYDFLDASIARFYAAEQRTNKLMGAATAVAVLIACLGLFGLATYSARQRTKEIGIRKIMGASVRHIVALLSRDFLKLVALAFGIAVPVAWYTMGQWLAGFTYRVGMGWGFFALAGGLALLIALLTVSAQSIKAALSNPADSLRNE
jgi:ABC-type antimicrobial peptide transport system permease subunit